MDKLLELRKNVEINDFMKLVGYIMNLPFNAVIKSALKGKNKSHKIF